MINILFKQRKKVLLIKFVILNKINPIDKLYKIQIQLQKLLY